MHACGALNYNMLRQKELNAIRTLSESPSLICEESYQSKPVLVDTSKVDVTIFKAILQEAEKPNRNNRIYTKKAIDEALNRTIIRERLAHKTWYGENGKGLPTNIEIY